MWLWALTFAFAGDAFDDAASWLAEAQTKAHLEQFEAEALLVQEERLLADKRWAELARLSGDAGLNDLLVESARVEQERAAASTSYGPKHPTLVALVARATELETGCARAAEAVVARENARVETLRGLTAQLAERRRSVEAER